MKPSFRDPSGRLFSHGDRIVRAINESGLAEFEAASASKTVEQFVRAGKMVGAKAINGSNASALKDDLVRDNQLDELKVSLLVEHDRIPFPNYPYEWHPEMLHSAAALTLELATELVAEGVGLKDATPYNILFRGPAPVFVDWLSIEDRDANDPTWLPQAQFVRTFILPLLINKHSGLSLSEIFISNRDGLEPEQAFEMVTGPRKYFPPFLSVMTLPRLLGSRGSTDTTIYEKRLASSSDKAGFILERQFQQLRKLLKKAAPNREAKSNWSDYLGPDQHFTEKYLRHKSELVIGFLEDIHPKSVLDVGCNTGYFSRIAAQSGASVVAIDQDEASVGGVWRMAQDEGLDILPLIVDITRPSPGIGWRNSENPPFLDRVTGRIDLALMLAVIHHMMVTERIPLPEILELFYDLRINNLVLEFVPPADPMFRTIARGRDHLFEYLTREHFEAECSRFFRLMKKVELADSNRWLYLLERGE